MRTENPKPNERGKLDYDKKTALKSDFSGNQIQQAGKVKLTFILYLARKFTFNWALICLSILPGRKTFAVILSK